MSLLTAQTPRQRLQRPSFGVNPSSAEKALSQSINGSGSMNRKPSAQTLGGYDPRTPSVRSETDFDVGDVVNVPGEMFGTVRFLGQVAGKNGKFVGVELSQEFAGRGKNDGDVDGVSYFTTIIPGSGIFLPVHRAEKRYSATISGDSPATPDTPSFGPPKLKMSKSFTPTPSLPGKFSQSVGLGGRPISPQFKAKRPSLPRPESPIRRHAPTLAPTPGKALSQSTRIGARPPLSATTPSKTNLRASTTQRPPQPSRPYSRSGSRLGSRADDEGLVGVASTSNGRASSISAVPSFSHPLRPSSRLGSAGAQDSEVQRLKHELAERDRRLEEQASSLSEMENSVRELSSLLPADGALGDGEEHTNAQLRQMLREKNEKIGLLTAEFDNHRADFRSTLDSLEMASTETERVYEEQKRDLLAQIMELQEMGSSKEDFEGVAHQLRQLEELVAELEEGLEESRRGEAEARSEVEFLRGEVERCRSELKREREKAAASGRDSYSADTASHKDLESRDDEIRGLKAIIHSLSSNPDAANGGRELLSNSGEIDLLRTELQASRDEKDALEKQLEQLRRDTVVMKGSTHARNESERTAILPPDALVPRTLRSRADTIRAPAGLEPLHLNVSKAPALPSSGRSGTYCEMCDSPGHDTLDCTHLQASDTTASEVDAANESLEKVINGTKDATDAAVEAKSNGADQEKWCALCEKDGHLAFDCPEEQY